MSEKKMTNIKLGRTIRIVILVAAIVCVIVFRDAIRNKVTEFAIHHVERVIQFGTHEYNHEWFGIPMLQYPNDLMLYQTVVYEVKPDVIVELGTFKGGLTHYFSMLLNYINPSAKVITVDIDGTNWRETVANTKELEQLRERITFIEGNSVEQTTIDQVAKLIPEDSKVLILLDSLHTKEHVLEEIEKYSPYVTKGSYLIVTDTHLDGTELIENKGPGPLAAVHEFMSEPNDFQIDESRNRFAMGTAVRDGFLKRVEN